MLKAYAKRFAKSSRKRPPSIRRLQGRLRELILVTDQLQLQPPLWISEVVAHASELSMSLVTFPYHLTDDVGLWDLGNKDKFIIETAFSVSSQFTGTPLK